MTIKFPPKPPAPGEIVKDPLKLKLLDPRILFDNEKKQILFTDIDGDETSEYQYSFIVDKWIPIGKRVLDEDELEEEANKEEFKEIKKQKIDQLKQEKEKLKSASSNTGVFLSNLPEITEEEIKECFEKYGSIALDKGKSPRIKLYYDNDDKFKGEALIIYENAPSVELAIQMMNETKIKDKLIKVESALFNSGEKNNQKLDEIKTKFYSKIVVISNMFRKQELEEDKYLKQDIEDDIREECGKWEIKDLLKVTVFPQDGIVTVKFRTSDLADKIIEKFNKRYYDGLKIECKLFTGTKYN